VGTGSVGVGTGRVGVGTGRVGVGTGRVGVGIEGLGVGRGPDALGDGDADPPGDVEGRGVADPEPAAWSPAASRSTSGDRGASLAGLSAR